MTNSAALVKFQSPISGGNDWNNYLVKHPRGMKKCFSLLLAELMIGTWSNSKAGIDYALFQSPISGVNDWNSGECVILIFQAK